MLKIPIKNRMKAINDKVIFLFNLILIPRYRIMNLYSFLWYPRQFIFHNVRKKKMNRNCL